MLLDKKNIIVVGGSSGIGRSAVKAFLNEGAFLTVIGRNSKKLLAVEIDLGNNGITIKGDASNPETINTAIKQSLHKFGDLHGLYHVAGGSGREKGDGPIHEISDKAWDYTTSINLDSIFYSNRAIIQQFIKKGKGGTILNMSSL
jgi:Dehydrogenases with different specificities (related to short-chain alcohol dehydrogenases)